MKKWKNIKIEEQLMKDIEKVKKEKHFKSKSKFLEDAVNEKLKKIKDEDLKDRLADIQEFLQKNAVTLRRKGINNIIDLTSQTLSNTEHIKRLEKKLDRTDEKNKRVYAIMSKKISQMTEEIVTEQNKILDDGKELTSKQVQEFAMMVRLHMDMDPEYAEHFKKLVKETMDVPPELMKKFSEI